MDLNKRDYNGNHQFIDDDDIRNHIRNPRYDEESKAYYNMRIATILMDGIYNASPSNGLLIHTIRIPKLQARKETPRSHIDPEDLPNMDCYEFYVIDQDPHSDRAFVLFKLPNSKKIVPIELYDGGSVDFNKATHKFVLRETDEIDRRIILGYCNKNKTRLLQLSLSKHLKFSKSKIKDITWRLDNIALHYEYTDSPKRFRRGQYTSNNENYYLVAGGFFKQIQLV